MRKYLAPPVKVPIRNLPLILLQKDVGHLHTCVILTHLQSDRLRVLNEAQKKRSLCSRFRLQLKLPYQKGLII